MKLESIKVKNFRTIDKDETIHIEGGLTIVGPNSSGKTNILKAIEMFFTGFDNKYNYQIERDLPEKVISEQTSLVATFIASDGDALELYKKLNELLEQPKEITNKITVYLLFSRIGHPSYRVFSGNKFKYNKKNEFNSVQKDFLCIIFNSFQCHYLPSSKSIDGLYKDLLLPFIKRSVAEKLQEKIEDINSSLKYISDAIDSQLNEAGMGHINSHFKIPNNSLEHLLSSFEYHLSDPVKTAIERKGMGIQSAAIFASLIWITNEEKKMGKNTIWLIEEPESYLHPELAHSCNTMLRKINEQSHLITTTHCLSFVPQDPKRLIGTEIEGNYTKIIKYDTYTKATSSIRSSLGVKFSDFCNLGLLNIFVEGKSDRELFQWVLSKINVKATGQYEWENVREAEFLDFGGTTALVGFLKATYEHIYKERPLVVVFDGDDAGDKARRDLQGFFGNKDGVSFNDKEQFIMLPKGFAVEGIFPHKWIVKANSEHPSWIKDFSTDIHHALLPFSMKNETTKQQLQEYLKKCVENSDDLDWAKDFKILFENINEVLHSQKTKLTIASS